MDLTVYQHQFSSSTSKVVASVNGSLQLCIISRGPRPDQGKIETFVDQLPPWPPPTPAFCSLAHTFSKNRGGTEHVQSISNAVQTPKASLPKSMCATVCSLMSISQQKRTQTDPAASLNRQDVLRHHRFRAVVASNQASSTAEQTTMLLVRHLRRSFNYLPSSSSPSPSASRSSASSSKSTITPQLFRSPRRSSGA